MSLFELHRTLQAAMGWTDSHLQDVGGCSGYAEFVEAISDTNHDEHDSMLEWVGGRFDIEHFDLIAAYDFSSRRCKPALHWRRWCRSSC